MQQRLGREMTMFENAQHSVGRVEALSDAMSARDRECRGSVGKFCRERETVVIERRQALDTAMQTVGGLNLAHEALDAVCAKTRNWLIRRRANCLGC
jgi:hypothetical protein